MARIYTDENFPRPVVVVLRLLGHDVLTTREDGRDQIGIPDLLVLARAVELGRAILTHDRGDYKKLHRVSNAHAGIITATRDGNFPALAARIDAAVRDLPSLNGLLIRVVKPNPAAAAGS